VAAARRTHSRALWLAGAALAALLAASGASAQGILRGTSDEDVITRVGRTSGDSQRNATPTGRRANPSVQPGQPDTLAEQNADLRAGNRAASRQRRAGTGRRDTAPRRPAQQNFRSLERPLNTTVLAPAGDQQLSQGLPPPPPPRRNGRTPEDPYAPLGLRLGTITVFPTLEAQGGYDSNPARAASGTPRKGSPVVRAEAGFTARSDWSRHELSADVRGAYSRYTALPSADRPEGSARLGGRLDVTKDTAIDAELRGRLDSQTPGTANLTGAAEGRPLTYQYGGSLGATQRFNRLAVSLRGSIDRSDFEDARDSTGATISQKDRQFTQYGMRLRAGYEVTPGLIPFVEALVDTRRYDLSRDNQGFQRDSNGVQARAGTTVEITRTLTGEVLAGYGLRRFEDQRLRDLRGPVVEAALNWAVTPLTTLRLRGTTEFEETTLVGSSGSITRRASAEVSHALLRNLVFTAGVSFARADYNGINRKDDTIRANLGVDYSLTRNVVFRASYARETTTSNAPGNNVSSNVWLFGARLQF
jgi:hypothetical protein